MRHIFTLLLLVLSFSAWSDHQIDSLSLAIEQASDPRSKVALMIKLAQAETLDSATAVQTYITAMEIAELNQIHELRGEAALGLGSFYKDKYAGDSAKFYLEKAILIYGEQQLRQKQVDAKSLLAAVFYNEDAHAESMSLLFEVLAYFEEVNDSTGIGKTLNRIANSQNYLGHHKDALDLYGRSLDIFNSTGDKKNQAIEIYNMALIFGEEKEFDKAMSYFRRSADLDQQIGNDIGMAETFTTMASNYDEMGKWDSAYSYYQSALSILDNHENEMLKGYVYRQMNKHFNMSGQPEKGLSLGLEALAIGRKMENVQTISNASLGLSETYEALGQYKQSLKYFKQYQQLEDSVYNLENSKIIHDMQAKYVAEKKEKELALKQADIDRQQALLAQEQKIRFILIAGILVVIILAGLIYKGERQKARAYDQLSIQNQEIAKKNAVIETALQEKESLLKEIHHRVKNNLQVISSILNMQSRATASPEMLTAIQEGQSRVKAMALIHQKLYQTEKLSEIDFKEYAEELMDHLSSIFQSSKGGAIVKTISSPDIKLDIDMAIPLGLILNELISNAYKYAFEGKTEGAISVELKRVGEDQLQLEVADNGKGMPADFNLEKAKSLGLKLVNILTRQLNGQMSVHSTGGAHFSILIQNTKVAT